MSDASRCIREGTRGGNDDKSRRLLSSELPYFARKRAIAERKHARHMKTFAREERRFSEEGSARGLLVGEYDAVHGVLECGGIGIGGIFNE